MSKPSVNTAALLTSQELLTRARDGDSASRDELASRYRPVLERFTHSRLPHGARGRFDTEDLVQEAFIRALAHLRSFSSRRRGAFLAYLRQIVVNMVRDELRSAYHRREDVDMAKEIPDPRRGPIETLFDRETRASYVRALETLSPAQQEAIVLRLELECDYAEIARVMGRPTAAAARMLVLRALARLAEAMSHLKEDEG